MVRVTPALRRRGGFTLVELLVVIAIISVLAAITVGAAFNVLESQRASRSQDFLRNVDKLLHHQWHKVVEDAKQETPSPAAVTMAGGDSGRAQVIWIKFRLMEAFPQTFAEINNPWVYTNDALGQQYIPTAQQKYNATYRKAIQTVGASHQAATESAACLYLILRIDRGGRLDEDNNIANIADTDNDGIKELVDNWGNPLTFIRFPIGTTTNPPTGQVTTSALSVALLSDLKQLNPNKTPKGQQYGDPDDPDGLLQQGNWFNTNTQAAGFGRVFTAKVHTVAAVQQYFTPVVISNGSDGALNSPAGSPDDIYSWRLRPGSKG
jgi:prepilin-type N-terminal cleavage/methylation domain-containing protein